MNINDIIQSAISLSEKYQKSPQTRQLRALADAIAQDKLKVVVLGDFKAGKSTLLNRLFIRKDMLPTDYQEATAVPTHLSSGSMGMNTWRRNPDGEEVLVNERISFSDADVAATVTASSEEERARKAQQYSRVSITMPGILPDNIILVDTPGLNTTNTAIYTGTLAEARTADAILYVVRAKQLSSREQSLITDLAGGQMLKVPVHIVLTHDSAANVSQTQLQNISQSIRAQLKLCKVDCGVSVFSLDGTPAVSSSVAERINTSVDDGFGFDEVPAAAPIVESTEEATDIESELLSFFNGEVRRGRVARIARELKPMLTALNAAVQARLSMADANEDEIKKIEEKKKYLRQEYLRMVESLLMDVRTAQYAFSNNIVSDLDALRDKCIKALKKLQSSGEILASISDWHQDMPEELQRVLAARRLELERDVVAICRKHQQEAKDKLTPGEIETDMPNDWLTKFVTFVPNWALVMADYIIWDLLSPLPTVLDVPLRMLADIVPLIRNFMPANIAANLARNVAAKKLTDCVRDIQQQVSTQLDNQFNELNKKLKAQLQEADIFAEQDAAIAEFRNGTLSASQKQQLKAEMEQISRWSLNI